MGKIDRSVGESIRMGEMSVAAESQTLRTLLGSCIGLALYDRRQRIGGLAHIVLPCAQIPIDQPGKYIDTAIPLLISRMQALADAKLKLFAKMAGGASMFATSATANIGLQNIESCELLLLELGIPVIGKHCGGDFGRRMSLDTSDGKVVIGIVGQDTIEF